MELYFKDLISKEASLEKLVDDLTLGAEDFAESIGAGTCEQTRRRVERFKESCHRLKENAVAGAQATDKLLRENPYAALGITALIGLFLGLKISAGKRRRREQAALAGFEE